MTFERAREIVQARGWLGADGALYSISPWLHWSTHSRDIELDGDFTADEIEAIAIIVRNHGAPV